MQEFMTELTLHADPRATRVVRMIRAEGRYQEELREDKEIIDLPPHYTRMGCYKSFIHGLGYRLVHDPKGRVTDVIALDQLPQILPASNLPSWFSFYYYWKNNFPLLKIQKAAKDIYDMCILIANQI